MRISVILDRLKIEDVPFLKPLQISPHQKSLFHTVQHSLQAADEIPFRKDGRIYPNLSKNSSLWKCLNTHNKSSLPAQWICIRDRLLTDFYTVGILPKNFCGAGRWKFLIAIGSVLNLELTFFEVFWLIGLSYCMPTIKKKKIKQQNTKIFPSHYSAVSSHIYFYDCIFLYFFLVDIQNIHMCRQVNLYHDVTYRFI